VAINKEITRLENSSLRMTLRVNKEDVRSQYDELLDEYVKSSAIPGFRRGKVPRDILERKFGAAFQQEVLGKIIGKTVQEVFAGDDIPRENKPLPYADPRLEDEPALDFDSDLCFSIVYDVLPQFTPGPWKGLEVEVPSAAVSEEDIARELEDIRDRSSIVLDRDEGDGAAAGDVVTVDYCELRDGGPVPGTERQDFVFTLGSGYNIYQFDEQLIGMKKDETRDITKTFPDTYPYKDLAGKTLTVRVVLRALKEKKLPDLNDELAQDVDEKYQTLGDLKNSIRERLGRSLDGRIREITVSRILEKILETTSIGLPESMVRLELDSRFKNLARRFNINQNELMDNLAKTGQDPQKMREEWRPEAERALKTRLIVETLMEELKLEASEQDLDEEIKRRAALPDSPGDFEQYYKQEQVREYLKEDIKERKLFDLLIAENKIKKGKKRTYLDLMGNKE
jgi:trigger factor